jgi:hypothetical protein
MVRAPGCFTYLKRAALMSELASWQNLPYKQRTESWFWICLPMLLFLSAQIAHCNLVCCCRWTDLENNPLMQQYANYGLGTAYGLIALVALVSRRNPTPAPMHVAAPVSVSTNPVSYEGF